MIWALALGCAGAPPPEVSARVDHDGGPVAHFERAPIPIPAGALPDDVQALEVQLEGVPALGPRFAIQLAVRLPEDASDDLVLMTTAADVGFEPTRVGPDASGALWAMFYIPNRSKRDFVLYDAGVPHPIEAAPLHWSEGSRAWDVPRVYRDVCTPGAELGHTVTITARIEDAELPDTWTPRGGTMRFVARSRCPEVKPSRGSEVPTLWAPEQFVDIEDVDGVGEAMADCVRREILQPSHDRDREAGADFEATWQAVSRADRTWFLDDDRAACRRELAAALDLGGDRATMVVTRTTVAHGPDEVPERAHPRLRPDLPLVRPERIETGAPHSPRSLLDHLDEPASTLLPLERPTTRPERPGRECTEAERGEHAVETGERCRVVADDPPVFEVGSGGGFWTALLLPDREVDIGRAYPVLGSSMEEVFAQQVYETLSRNDEQLLCRTGGGVTIDGSRAGAFARVDFDADDGCWLWVGTDGMDAADGGKTRMGWVVDPGLQGTAWVRDDLTLDVEELRSHHRRMQLTRIRYSANAAEPNAIRQVLVDLELGGEPTATCKAWPRIARIPNEIVVDCGKPEWKLGLWLSAVLMPDGTVQHATIHELGGEAETGFPACAIAAATSVSFEPTGCPPVPVLTRL